MATPPKFPDWFKRDAAEHRFSDLRIDHWCVISKRRSNGCRRDEGATVFSGKTRAQMDCHSCGRSNWFYLTGRHDGRPFEDAYRPPGSGSWPGFLRRFAANNWERDWRVELADYFEQVSDDGDDAAANKDQQIDDMVADGHFNPTRKVTMDNKTGLTSGDKSDSLWR